MSAIARIKVYPWHTAAQRPASAATRLVVDWTQCWALFRGLKHGAYGLLLTRGSVEAMITKTAFHIRSILTTTILCAARSQSATLGLPAASKPICTYFAARGSLL